MLPLPPFVYRIIYKIVAILVLMLACFGYGYNMASDKGKNEIAEFKAAADAKYKALEKKKNIVVEKIVTQYVDKLVYITKWRTRNVEITKIVPDSFELSNGWVYTHDISAAASYADPARASDATSSGVAANQALGVVVDNYAICKETREQLIALQNSIVETQKLVDETNKAEKEKAK